MNRIEPGNEFYEELLSRFQQEGGTRTSFQGAEWMKVEDDGKVVFVRVGNSQGINDMYGSTSIPRG